jgi:uncharacterized LabA/DUF88 family protein
MGRPARGERNLSLSETRLKIAVFIDFDNIEIGVKTTLGGHFDVGAVLEAIKERGEVVTKIAYGDWTRAGDYSRSLTQHAIHMVQRNLTPGGDKNGADINLALDALEMAFTHNHINAFVIVGGDSDFMALVEKLKQYDRKVFVVGGRAFTSVILQKNCTEFIAYENLVSAPQRGRSTGGRTGGRAGETPALNAVPLIRRALKVLADREVSPQLGVLKSTLLQLDSTFSEREYGASTFRDFVQRLARAGYVTLKGTDRNIYVELKEGADGAGAAPAGAGAASGASSSGAGTGLAAAGSGAGSGTGQAALPASKDAVDADAADASDPALTTVIEGDFGGVGGGVGAGAGVGLPGDVAGGGVDADGGLTGAGGAGSLGEAAVDQGPGANGSPGANEAYASGVADSDDTDTVPSSTAAPSRVWERVRDSDRRESERGTEGGKPDAGRGGDDRRAADAGRTDAGRSDAGRQPNGARGQGSGGGGGRRDAGGGGQVGEGASGPAGSPPAALRFISDVFHRPGTVQRWPLYLRQVKQILRSVDESFDERRYGFTGIVEALRYCQREGLFRLDRDRQGVLRVYPGPVLQRASTAAPQHAIDTDATPGNVAAVSVEDDDNRGNRIESGDRYERGGRGDRRDRGDREERAARGDRSDRGDRGEGGDRDARGRREDRPEYGEPLVPGTLELFPLTEATADADSDATAGASGGDGVHGPLTDDATAVSPAEADVMSDADADASASTAETGASDDESAPRAAGARKRTARGGRSAKKTAAKSSSKSGKSAAPAEKRAAEKPAAEKSSSKGRAAKNTRARKAAKS